jgi:hypothetical protein
MPKIVSANSMAALATAPGAHHYRFVGVELTVASSLSVTNYALVQLGNGTQSSTEVPHHLIFDRVYVHGTSTHNVRRGFAFNSAHTAVIDSHISEMHELGVEAQAILGWNGPGPFKIVNNYLEAAGENVMFGGVDPSITNLVPSDIEFRGNHCYKPTRWRVGSPDYAGKAWVVKNIFELKNARRVWIEGNVFENNWAAAQNGFAILFTVRNQSGGAPWSTVEDVTFIKNVVRHTGSAVNVLAKDDNHPSGRARRILIKDNVFDDVDSTRWGGTGRLLQVLDGPAELVFDHNTAFHNGHVVAASGLAASAFVYRNNITPHNTYGVGGDGTYGNPLLTLSTYFPGAIFSKNVLVGGTAAKYPATNYFPGTMSQVGFVALTSGNYRLASTSPYRNAGTDGRDLGADFAAVEAASAAAISGNSTAPPPPPPPPPPGDTTPPVLSGLSVTSVTASGVTVNWQTNESSNTQIQFGPTTSYGSQQTNTTMVTAHAMGLTGLAPSTTYHARALSRDAAGNTGTSADFLFTTTSGGSGGGAQNVTWTALVNVSVSGDTISKTGGCSGCQDAGAVSTQTLSGDGYLEFTVPATTTQRLIGLSKGNSSTQLNDIDYALRFWAGGGLSIAENGLYRVGSLTYAAGDVFRIAVASGSVRYYKNGTLLYTSALAPAYPLLVDTSFLDRGGAFSKVVLSAGATASPPTQPPAPGGTGGLLESIAWTALVNLSVSGETLSKTAGCSGCQDAGAISTQTLSGDGYLELTVPASGTQRVIGLSKGNSSTRMDDIDFGLRFWSTGGVGIQENGVYISISKYYQAGDVFRVAVSSGVVRYYKNGALLYTSARTPSFPLLVDTSFLDRGGALSKVVMRH